MKTFIYEITYLELAKLFMTTQNQIATWIKRDKFSLVSPHSIFEFYRIEGSKIIRRYEEFELSLKLYKQQKATPKEREYVEKMLKEWNREEEIIQIKPKIIPLEAPKEETVKENKGINTRPTSTRQFVPLFGK